MFLNCIEMVGWKKVTETESSPSSPSLPSDGELPAHDCCISGRWDSLACMVKVAEVREAFWKRQLGIIGTKLRQEWIEQGFEWTLLVKKTNSTRG